MRVDEAQCGPQLRATMSSFFLIGSLMSIAMLALTGAVDRHTVAMFGALVPAAVLGYVLSRYVNRLLNPQRQRWTAITVSLIGAGVSLST